MMDTTDNYRYPGSRPFQDTDHDRRIFFGREQEAESLLHLILAEHLVVLFAKSGMGKTSLLNAGVLKPLRERGFLPLKIRFRDPAFDPLQTVYAAIEETVTLRNIDYHAGEKATLWHYFKSVEFWNADDTLLTPVLILDQFEEFFHLYLPDKRKAFITQFADLVKGRKPQTLQENESAYTDTPPNVKVIISIREDFIGQLEEMAREIPAILQNRFRILPLNRTQARQAIIEPAQLEDTQLNTKSFRYAPDTLEAILGFLCERRKRRETTISPSQEQSLINICLNYISHVLMSILNYFHICPRKPDFDMVKVDEIEPFQLQLLCQYIEIIVIVKYAKEEGEVIVHEADFGGEIGMRWILQNFYDRQIKRLDPFSKARKARKLCEKGLISATDRRVSLEEEDIERRFKVSKLLLAELVDNRLLRVEPRVSSLYYELSHDTLVEPIRSSQAERKSMHRKTARKFMFGIILFACIYVFVWHRHYIYNLIGEMTKDQRKAIAYYQKAIEFNSEYVTAYYNWGNALFFQSRFDEAIAQYQKAIELAPKNPNFYNKLGSASLYQAKYDEAVVQYQKAIELAPDDPNFYQGLGRAFHLQNKYDEAIAQYQKALQLAPGDAYFYRLLGDAFFAQAKYDETIAQYQKAIELAPDDPDFYNQLGNVFFEQGNYEEAVVQYRKAIELAPDEAYIYNNLGNAFFQQTKYGEADEQYRKAIELAPDDSDSYSRLGNVFFVQGKYDEAIVQYQKATDLAPTNSKLYYLLGNVFFNQNKYEEAIVQYQKAIELAPDKLDFYSQLGKVFFEQGKCDEAIAQYQKAIELDPNYVFSYANLGYAFMKQAKYEEAAEQYQKAIALAPNNADFYNNLGYVFLVQDRYGEAIDQYQKAIKFAPDNPDFYNNLGSAFYRQAKYQEAIGCYRKAIELDSEYASAYYNLGITFSKQTKYEEAIEQYNKAIELDSEDVNAKSNLAEIYLITERFEPVLALADEVLNEQEVPTQVILEMRLLSVSALFFQEKQIEAVNALQDFIISYPSFPEYETKDWIYERSKEFISNTEKLSEIEKALLLSLIDILETPKPQADSKLQELKMLLEQLKQEQ